MQRLVNLCPLRRDTQIVISHEHVDAVEECAEQVALRAVNDAGVELDRVIEQVDVGEDHVGAVLGTAAGAGEAFRDGALLHRDEFQSVAQFAARDCAFGGELDQAILLLFERAQPCAE